MLRSLGLTINLTSLAIILIYYMSMSYVLKVDFMRIAYFFLLLTCSVCTNVDGSRASGTAEDSDIFGWFRGLDLPFASSQYPQYSPAWVFDNSRDRSRRMFGDYGPCEVEKFVRPVCTSEETSPLYPQNIIASLFERLFPSIVGLVVNTSRGDKVNNYLKPKNLALIFIAKSRQGFFESEQMPAMIADRQINQATLQLVEAMLPEVIRKNITAARKRNVTYEPSKDHATAIDSIIEIAELLMRSFKYDSKMAERILLLYMCEKNQGKKADLKPYYIELAKAGFIDEKLVSRIVWSGEGSHYTLSEYLGKKGLTPLEQQLLAKLGYPYFEAGLPPMVHWGMTSVYVNKIKYYASDCGDSILRNLFMILLCRTRMNTDGQTVKIFDVSPLLRLKKYGCKVSDALINYFEHKCPSPVYANTNRARYEWSKVVNGLNKPGDIYKVKYLLPSPDKGFYAIDVGVDNMLRVVGKLFGDPPEFDMEMKERYSCNRNFNWIGEVFSDPDERYCWSIETVPHGIDEDTDLADQLEIRPARDWRNLTAIFKIGTAFRHEPVFEWHFEERHFDYTNCYRSKLNFDDIWNGRIGLCEAKLKSIVDMVESVYESDLDSIDGKFEALDKILWYRKATDPAAFEHVLSRWLEPQGTFFLGWNYARVNSRAVNVLLKHMSVPQILALDIQKLYRALVWPLAEKSQIEEIKLVLNKDLELLKGQPFQKGSLSKMARVLASTLERGDAHHLNVLLHAGVNSYALSVSGVSLLHLAAFAGNRDIDVLIDDVNAKTADGKTPLHFAAMARNGYFLTTIKTLLSYGANVNEKTNDGLSALHFAVSTIDQMEDSVARILAAEEIRCKDCVSYSGGCFDGVDYFGHRHAYAERIDLLVKSGADITEMYKAGISYADWASGKNNDFLLNIFVPQKIVQTPRVKVKTVLRDNLSDSDSSD